LINGRQLEKQIFKKIFNKFKGNFKKICSKIKVNSFKVDFLINSFKKIDFTYHIGLKL
jgi:hypothetical protein